MHRYEVRSVRALAADKSYPAISQSSREDSPLKKRGTHDIGFDGTTSSDAFKKRRLDLFHCQVLATQASNC